MKQLWFLAGWLFLSGGAFLSAQTEESVDRLLKVTGVTEQVTQNMESMGTQFESLKSLVSGSLQKLVIRALQESFTPRLMLAAKRDVLLKSGRQDLVDQVLKTYEAPWMQVITQLEIDAGKPENRQKQSLPLDLTPERKAMIQKFMQDTRFVEQMIKTMDGVFDGFLLALGAADQAQYDRTVRAFETMKPMIAKNLSSEKQLAGFVQVFGHIYSQVSDQDLQKYFDFYSTEQGQWLTDIFFLGTKEGYKRCAEAAGALIVKGKASTDEI